METYDYKEKPAKRKKEEAKLPTYSDMVVQNGNSYRRLTKSELRKQKEEAKAKVQKEQEDKEATERLINDIFDAIGGFIGFLIKMLPFVFIFFVFFGTGIGGNIIGGFEQFLGDVLPGTFDGTFQSRIMIFIMIALPVFIFMQSNRRYRRWF